MRNAVELWMMPSRCSSVAMCRVLQPGHSRTNMVCAGFTGRSAAQVNHMASASTSTATSLKKLRTGYSSLDEPGSFHAADGRKRDGPSGRPLLCSAGGNQFGGPAGDRGVVAEALEPQHIRLAAKPRHLPLGIVAMSL